VKAAAGALLAVLAVAAAIIFAWPTASRGPEPIRYDRDQCAGCRMHLSQTGYAGELRDVEGRVTKYDDVGCLVRTLASAPNQYPGQWAEDHESGQLVALETCTFVRSSAEKTPMGYGVVAYRDAASALRAVAKTGGRTVSMKELLKGGA